MSIHFLFRLLRKVEFHLNFSNLGIQKIVANSRSEISKTNLPISSLKS